MAAKLEVQVIGDASSLQRALRQSSTAASTFGSRMASAGKAIGLAAVGVGAAVTGGMIVTLKRGFDELAESQKVMAQTEAALKSTGGVANVTAKDVEGLASSLSAMSGVDDEVIQASENLLLTFKNVRNEAGKGNKVFDEATKAALNLSVAGFGSLESTSKMLGKALNDPIKGMTAMGRAGVTFSQDQKKAIEAMVETGDLLGAQKVILQEVESQVGGSAKAYGETLPGQLAKARNAFDEIAGKVAQRFLPALTAALDWVNSNWPTIERVINAVATGIIAGFQAIATSVNWLRGQWEQHRRTVTAVWNAIESAVSSTIAWFKANVVPAIQNVVTAARAIWDRFGAAISAITKTYFGMVFATVSTLMRNIKSAIEIVTALIRGDWDKAWKEMKAIVGRSLELVWKLLTGAVSIALRAAKEIGGAILDGLAAGLKGIVARIRDGMQWLWAWLREEAPGLAKDAATAIGAGIWDGIVAGFKSVFSSDALSNEIRRKVDQANSSVGSTAEEYAARTIGAGLGRGTILGFLIGSADLPTKMRDRVRSAVEAMASTLQTLAATAGIALAPLRNAIASKIAEAGSAIEQARFAEKMGRQLDALVVRVEAQKARLEAAFQRLADAAMRAFDARTTAGLAAIQAKLSAALAAIDRDISAQAAKIEKARSAETPAEKALRQLDEAEAKRQREAALAAAKQQLADAEAGKGFEAREGETPEDAAAREAARLEAVKAAREALRQAELAIDRAALEAQAAAERKAADEKAAKQQKNLEANGASRKKAWQQHYDNETLQYQAERDLMRQNMDMFLAAQWEQLQKSPKQWEKIHRRIMTKFEKDFGPDFSTAGKNLGVAFAEGLTKSLDAMESAAEKLANMIAAYLKTHSPTERGPMSDLDTWWKGFVPALISGFDHRGLSQSLSSVGIGIGPGASGGLGASSGAAAGGGVVNVYVSGSVLSERDLVDAVRQGLIREGRRTGPNLLGGYA